VTLVQHQNMQQQRRLIWTERKLERLERMVSEPENKLDPKKQAEYYKVGQRDWYQFNDS
jgi:hypothetical protein